MFTAAFKIYPLSYCNFSTSANDLLYLISGLFLITPCLEHGASINIWSNVSFSYLFVKFLASRGDASIIDKFKRLAWFWTNFILFLFKSCATKRHLSCIILAI